jgi:putative sporulation protein YtaF
VHFFTSFLLAVAVSFDGLGAGFAYGVRNLYVPYLSLLIISISSSLALLAAMFMGRAMATFLPGHVSSYIGGGILLLVGAYIVRGAYNGQEEAGLPAGSKKKAPSLRGILREPEKADLDSSGSISSREAAILGLALAMDAFGAGFGAAMAGYSPLITCVLVGFCKLIFISGGVSLGKRYAESLNSKKAGALAGGVLILLGLINII